MSDNAAILADLSRRYPKAHAPYSGVQVAAGVQAPDGTIHYGVNVENAAYPQGVCAEAGAISAAVIAGATRIDRVYLASNLPGLIWPCGGCRQKIFELSAPGCEVVSLGADGEVVVETIEALLPRGFRLPGQDA